MSLTETFCKSIALTVTNKYGKGAAMQISTMFRRVYHGAFRKIPWKWDFLGIDLTRFFRVRNFGNTSAMRLIFFFSMCSKFKLDFEKAENDSKRVFWFRDTYIWIGCVKLSLLWREYLPSALSVLPNRLETLHITNRDFLKGNCMHSDQ